MSDEQAATYIFRRVQARGSDSGSGPGLYRDRGLPGLGGETALRRWIKQLQQERSGITPQSKALTPEQQKIQALEARIHRLEREKAILKKLLLS